MEFSFRTEYDRKAVTAMARGLRRTIRKKRNRRTRIFGWIVILFGLLLTLPLDGDPLVVDKRTVVTWVTGAVLLSVLLFEDRINGYFARRRMMAGTEVSETVFTREDYRTQTAAGSTQWKYENVAYIAEDQNYFIFIFDQRYAQVYDKNSLQGGSAEEFRTFLMDRTGKEICAI